MGIDIGAMFGDALKSAEQGMSDTLQQGGNAALGYLEQNAINLISADKKTHEEAYQTAVAKNLAQPANPNSFGSYLSNITQSPVIKQYGVYILGAVALIVGATLVMKGR